MSSGRRELTYGSAINEALRQMLSAGELTFLIGQGVKSPWYVGSTCAGLLEEFGEERIIDTPVSENAVTGAAVGAAIAQMRAVVIHPRMDFMMYAFDPIINQAANWHYMSGGNSSVPVVIWGVINRRGEQGAQHSQAFQAPFAHVPGLKVVAPATACDAKGLMITAIRDENPVVFVDDRSLYGRVSDVAEEPYETPIGKGVIRREGDDLTIVATSFVAAEAVVAADDLADQGISAEVIDLRTIKPWDEELTLRSVGKTGRLLVVDGAWRSFGVSAEIAATISERAFGRLREPVRRLALPDSPAPASEALERAYYIDKDDIARVARKMVR